MVVEVVGGEVVAAAHRPRLERCEVVLLHDHLRGEESVGGAVQQVEVDMGAKLEVEVAAGQKVVEAEVEVEEVVVDNDSRGNGGGGGGGDGRGGGGGSGGASSETSKPKAEQFHSTALRASRPRCAACSASAADAPAQLPRCRIALSRSSKPRLPSTLRADCPGRKARARA